MATTTPQRLRAKLERKQVELRTQIVKRYTTQLAVQRIEKAIAKKRADIQQLKEKLVDLQG